jgi:hypothetical protein
MLDFLKNLGFSVNVSEEILSLLDHLHGKSPATALRTKITQPVKGKVLSICQSLDHLISTITQF